MIRISFLICLIAVVFTHTSFAQNIDLDKEKFNTEYTILPTNPTLSYFDTYSVDFFAEQALLDQLLLTTNDINSYFDLPGYVFTKDQAQFNYSISIQRPIEILEMVETIQETYNSTDGNAKYTTKYVAVISYSIPTTISLKLIPYGTVVYTSDFSTAITPTVYRSAPQITAAAAQNMLSFDYKGINVYARSAYKKSLQSEITKMKVQCCFTPFTSTNFFWKINEKKAPEYAPFNTEVSKAISILEKTTKSTSIESMRLELSISMKYWENIIATTQANSKKTMKLEFACLHNLAVCQYYLEQFDTCKTTCRSMLQLNYNKNEVQRILVDAETAQREVRASGLKTRHQDRPGFSSTEKFQYTNTSSPVKK